MMTNKVTTTTTTKFLEPMPQGISYVWHCTNKTLNLCTLWEHNKEGVIQYGQNQERYKQNYRIKSIPIQHLCSFLMKSTKTGWTLVKVMVSHVSGLLFHKDFIFFHTLFHKDSLLCCVMHHWKLLNIQRCQAHMNRPQISVPLPHFEGRAGTEQLSCPTQKIFNQHWQRIWNYLKPLPQLFHNLPKSWHRPASCTHFTSFSVILSSGWSLFKCLITLPAK